MSISNSQVFIIDDDEGIRDSLAWMLRCENLLSVQFDSAEAFLEEFDPAWRGCILLDVRMPGKSGLDLQRELNRHQPTMPIILLTAHGSIGMVTKAMKAGAFDFIRKPYRDEQVLDSIAKALDLDDRNFKKYKEVTQSRVLLDRLTEREKAVLELIMTGLTNKQISMELNISERTVESHRSRIMIKTDSNSLPQLVQTVMKAKSD